MRPDPEYPNPRIRLARPVLGEEEIDAVARVLRSGSLTNGAETTAFEREFAAAHEVEHAVAVANGTVALVAILAGLNIGPGDEVIVPSMTFISSATSVLHVGASPVFADIDPDTLNLDPTDVQKRITKATKAIMVVHYGGQAGDIAELIAVAEEAGIPLLEDAAEAHGARYRGRHVGGWGRAGMFSFTPTKNITMGEGGVVTTDDGDLAKVIRLLRNHGQTRLYEHEILGWNWRLTEMQAAIGRVQLTRLPTILKVKRSNASRFRELLHDLPGLQIPCERADRDHVFMLYTIIVERGRDRVVDNLRREGIEARVYFPPAHKQPLFRDSIKDLPWTDELAGRILSIPCHSNLSADDIGYIAQHLRAGLALEKG
jgi:perosamine synthetase